MAPRLTQALVSRHASGRPGAYGAALLDIAQDHLLWLLADENLFDEGRLIFKGGTSLRKCRLGTSGRFSTDLDFTAPDDDVVIAACEVINGAVIGGFTFTLDGPSSDARHWRLRIDHSELGTPDVDAAVEFARRPLACAPERLQFIESPVHKAYDIALPELPIIAIEEACAEKLARYRRASLARDLYDLAKFAERTMDEALVRRLWVLKVWGDVVEDQRGKPPVDPSDVLNVRAASEFKLESIGILVDPADIAIWESRVRSRFGFLAQLDADERRWAACSPRDRYEVHDALARIIAR